VGSEQVIQAGVDDAIARCLGVPTEESPDELDKQVELILGAAAKLNVKAGLLRLRNDALARVADAEAAAARAGMARDGARESVQRAAELAERAGRVFGHFLPPPGLEAGAGLVLRSLNVVLLRHDRLRERREALAVAERALLVVSGARLAAQQQLAAAEEVLAVLPPTGVTVEP
jgi:hypothetical protein